MRFGSFKLGGVGGVVLLVLCSALIMSGLLWAIFPAMSGVEHLASGRSKTVDLPWIFYEVSNGNHLSVKMPVHWLTPLRWNITPDDRLTALTIDGRAVPLDGIRPGGLSDWQHGFSMDLSLWRHGGNLDLEFTVDNYAWGGGIALHPHLGWRVPLLAVGLLPWLLALTRIFRLHRKQTVILGAALLVLSFYWAATPWTVRNYDVLRVGETGHLDYINYIATHLALPRPDQGWEFYQPPLYYLVAALVWRWAQCLGASGPETLQAFALALWLVFLVASASVLRMALGRRNPALVAATAALALWPSGIIHGVRIGNDPPLYALAAVATWFMFRWWRGGRCGMLLGMALSIAMALLCKGSAFALPVAATLLIALRMGRAGRWRKLRSWIEAAAAEALMATGMLLSVARNLYYWWRGLTPSVFITSMNSLETSLRVPNQLSNYLPLDIPVFLTSPWIDSRDDATGRTNFWNFLLRSSLSGEFHFDGNLQRVTAWLWGVLLLWLLGLLLLSACTVRWSLAASWRRLPWIVFGLSWLACLLSLRITHPFSSHNDVRLILPILLPFIIACARSGKSARIPLLGIALSSALFFVDL